MLKKLIVVILAALVTAGFWFGSQLTVKQKVKKMPVVVAAKDIPARTQITEEMLSVIGVPATGIPPGIAKKKEDVVGLYTISNFGVPKNGYFFTSVVKKAEEITDGATMMLKPGEELVAMNIDLQKYLGGNAVPGAVVNLWFSAKPKNSNSQPVVGMFAQNIRILGARDSKALETTAQEPSEKDKNSKDKNKNKTSVAKVLLLAMPENEIQYFFMAQSVGQVYPTGLQDAIQSEEGSAITTSVVDARKWLEANVMVLSNSQQQENVNNNYTKNAQ